AVHGDMEHEVCGSRGTMASRPAACGFVDNPPGGTRQGRWVLSGLSTNPQAHHPQASKKDTSDEGRPTRLSPGPKGTFLLCVDRSSYAASREAGLEFGAGHSPRTESPDWHCRPLMTGCCCGQGGSTM